MAYRIFQNQNLFFRQIRQNEHSLLYEHPILEFETYHI